MHAVKLMNLASLITMPASVNLRLKFTQTSFHIGSGGLITTYTSEAARENEKSLF